MARGARWTGGQQLSTEQRVRPLLYTSPLKEQIT
jgi:hypothetical protein